MMKKQLQGINFILFGIMLMMFARIDPWIPFVGSLSFIALWAGLVSGIVGVIFSLKK